MLIPVRAFAKSALPSLKAHGLAVVVFAAAAFFWAVISWSKGLEQCTSDLLIYFGIVLKEHDASLFPRDLLFGDRKTYLHFPLFTEFLKYFFERTGDLTYGLKLLTFPLNFLYMLGAYVFFGWLTRNRPAATLLSLLSSLPLSIPLGAENFGIGPATLMTPRVIFTAFVPAVLYLYYRAMIEKNTRMLLGAFFLLGVLANVYAISAFLLVQVLLLLVIFRFGFNLAALLTVGRCGLLSFVGSLPSVVFFLTRSRGVDEDLPVEMLAEVFRWRIPYAYPQAILLGKMPESVLHALTGAIALAPLIFLWTYRRRRQPAALRCLLLVCCAAAAYMADSGSNRYYLLFAGLALVAPWNREVDEKDELSLSFGFSVFYVGVVGVMVIQAVYAFFGVAPIPIIHQFRAIRFSGFLLFLLAAICVKWFLLPSGGILPGIRIAVAALGVLVAFMGVRDAYRTHARTRESAETADLVRMASWAKAHTAKEALFLFDSPLFRILAERSLVVATKDVGMFIVAKRNVREAYGRLQEIGSREKDVAGLLGIAARYGAEYVVLRRKDFPALTERGIAYRDGTYVLLVVARTA
jgi:hypothetical protein